MFGKRILAAVLAASLVAAASGLGSAPASSWRHAALWDDGRAEFCVYQVTWARYGNLYPGRAVLVTVKEPWAPDLDVKADRPRPDGFDVLKLNHARDVPTGIYTYHQMSSVYFRRDNGTVRKMAATSVELCGVSTADMTGGTLRTRSYFDGQGDRAQPWPAAAWPEDGLPLALRDYVKTSPPATLQVFPSLMSGRFTDTSVRTMRLQRLPPKSVEVPAGKFTGVEIRLQDADGFLAYTFEPEPPHRLLLFQSGDGTEYRLAKGERLKYWEEHDPGDEAWLPPGQR